MLARSLKLDVAYLAEYGGGVERTYGIESTDETAHNEVVHLSLQLRHGLGIHPSGDDGMVVCYLFVIKDILALSQRFTLYTFHISEIVTQTIHDLRTFGIDVVG